MGKNTQKSIEASTDDGSESKSDEKSGVLGKEQDVDEVDEEDEDLDMKIHKSNFASSSKIVVAILVYQLLTQLNSKFSIQEKISQLT